MPTVSRRLPRRLPLLLPHPIHCMHTNIPHIIVLCSVFLKYPVSGQHPDQYYLKCICSTGLSTTLPSTNNFHLASSRETLAAGCTPSPPLPAGQSKAPRQGDGDGGPAAARGVCGAVWAADAPPPHATLSPFPSTASTKKGTKEMCVYRPAPAGAAPVVVGQATAVVGSPFPATNAANQCICCQCGLPGCYKEGKCVEKWGLGTVRKKMKRIERHGMLKTAAFQARMHRTDTLPALYRERELPSLVGVHAALPVDTNADIASTVILTYH
ncbi:hypothetical protein GGX14DRAFT_644028 [Mycena pura]|uniref:Uncharacterized protein n=1 Tax=Mycena pura TaxID=153505 RepID=A0AAD6YCQ6_9AGAR|nr:hypothetical protein GGX14DRAFT_644028 [Mycena pura]